jgi:hypothetical protein
VPPSLNRYAGVYGPLDWALIDAGDPRPASRGDSAEIIFPPPSADPGDCGGVDMDLELAGIQQEGEEEESPLVTAPPNRISELNTTLQALGSEIGSILKPSADQVSHMHDTTDLSLAHQSLDVLYGLAAVLLLVVCTVSVLCEYDFLQCCAVLCCAVLCCAVLCELLMCGHLSYPPHINIQTLVIVLVVA